MEGEKGKAVRKGRAKRILMCNCKRKGRTGWQNEYWFVKG